jgi:hypothetical protein
MKKWVVLIIACLFTNILSQTNISPQFSELKGMEDQLGDTHLFYRIYEYFSNQYVISEKKNIFHLDLSSGSDTLFLSDSRLEAPTGNYFNWVSDLDFWNNNPSEFIYCGGTLGGPYYEGMPYVRRFDGYETTFQGFAGSADYVDISSTNDSLLYLGGWVQPTTNPFYFDLILAKSLDGGLIWDTLSLTYRFLSVIPYRENIFFVDDLEAKLYRTTDSGNTFNLVDPEFLPYPRFFYDADEQHIYRKTNNKLIASDNLGEQFSWQTKYSSDSEIFFSIDETTSGTIYLADKKNIFKSTDYGNSFNLYKTMERKIVGIYKKPNSNKLYAATKYNIYEITPDTVQAIKSLPIPEEILNYYPLAIGNKWIYDEVTYVQDPYPNVYFRILVKEVLGDSIAPNGKYYFKVNDETIWESSVLERVDSSDGKVYRYYEDPTLPESEYVAYDLLAEVGDTINSFRQGFNTVMFTTMFAQSTLNKWGVTKPKKVFEEYTLHPPVFSLTQDFGLDSIYSYFDFGDTWVTLKGCIIDGVVYGDTTTVGVEDEEKPIASEFNLEQNYPNPFNPSTVISYRLPVSSNVTLKVYDVLGNEIATLVNEEKPAGEYEIEFRPESSIKQPASGIYFYQLKAGEFIQTRKMIYLK